MSLQNSQLTPFGLNHTYHVTQTQLLIKIMVIVWNLPKKYHYRINQPTKIQLMEHEIIELQIKERIKVIQVELTF